jgi:outer membrane protein
LEDSVRNRIALALLVTLSSISSAAAQSAVNFPHTLVISQAALQAAAQAPVPPPGQGAQTPVPPPGQKAPAAIPGQTGPRVPLTLDEAVKLALDHNLDIAVSRLNPPLFDLSLASLRSVYSPTLTSTILQQSSTNPGNTTLNGVAAGSGITAGTQNFNGGVAQNVAWGGGNFSVALNNTRGTTTSPTSLFNPLYTPNWSATYTQPVLRNFKIDSTREQLIVTKLNQDISDIQLQATIINTQANVRNAYWDYVFAIQSVDVAQQSLDLANDLVKNNQTKVQIGTLAPIDVVQAQSQAAAQRQTLVTAQGTARTAEIALKRIIVGGTSDPLWTSTLDPVDRPDFSPAPIDVNAAILKAQSTRTDVAQAKKNLAVNDETLKFLNDQTLPQADLVGRYGLAGQGGTEFLTSGSGITRTVTGTVPGGYSDALSTLFKRNFPTWSVSLNLSYPLGMSAQKAAIARAKIQENQVDAQLKQIDLQVATDVENAGVNVENSAERVQAAQSARDLAQQQLNAENSKFNVGMSTNYNIVQAQRDLATAQNNELQAILAYRKALVEFDRVQQTGTAGNITIIGSAGTAGTTGGGAAGGAASTAGTAAAAGGTTGTGTRTTTGP